MINLVKKYRNISFPVKAAFWFAVSNVFVKGISFITLPIFSRILLPEEYGVIYVYQTWVGIISIFTTLGLWGGVFKVSIAKYHGEKKRIVAAYQGLATTITAVVGIIFFIFRKPLGDLLDITSILVIVMFVEILSQIPINIWTVSEQFDYKYRNIIFLTIINSILIPLFSYIGIVLFPANRAEAKIIWGLIPQIIEGIAIFAINVYSGKSYYDRELWKFGFSFNVVLIPHYLSTLVLGQSDRIMISKMCGSADAGVYSIAYTFAMLITLFSNAIESSLTPHIYKSIEKQDTSKLTKEINMVIVVLAFFMVVMMCFIPDVFMMMLPDSYYESIWVIPPVVVGIFFVFIYSIFGSVEFYYKENKFVTIASCVGAILNIFLNYIFISIFGYIAAAYTTLFCYIVFAYTHYFFMKAVMIKNGCKFNVCDIKFLNLVSVILVTLAIIMEFFYSYAHIRWGVITLCIITLICFRKKMTYTIKQFLGW